MKHILSLIFISLPFARASDADQSAVRIEKNVAYLEPDRAEKADLYMPPKFELKKKYPGIVIIHGGGWTGGDVPSIRDRT